MSLHYLLDGYNVIKKTSTLASKKLEDGRCALVSFIAMYRPQGSDNNSVTIVFDGRSDVFGGMRSAPVKVIFTSGESADEKIKQMVADSKRKKQTVVVSDDRDIQFAVRALGAKVMRVTEFLSRGRWKEPAAPPQLEEDSKGISATLAREITKEFETIWLKKGKAH